MNPVVHYSKQKYIAKIEALETYIAELKEHLETMESYRDRIDYFWHDAKAREVYNAMNKQIINVRNAMSKSTRTLATYKKVIEEMEGVNIGVSDILTDASAAIELLDN